MTDDTKTKELFAAVALVDELRSNPNASPREIYSRLLARGIQLTMGGRPLFDEDEDTVMKKPIVGSSVHYTSGSMKPLAAIVTGIYDELQATPPTSHLNGSAPFVSLCVFNDGETSKGRADTSHLRFVGFSVMPRYGCWSWPPKEAA